MSNAAAIGSAPQWPPGRRLFFSTQLYGLGKRLGHEAAAREFDRMVQQPTRLDPPVARMIHRTRQLGTVAVFHSAGTVLPKLRSRAAYAALQSEAEHWLLCDDDVECDSGTLMRCLQLAGPGSEPVIVLLPCLLRGVSLELHTVNVEYDGAIVESRDGELCRKVIHGGCGFMIVSQGALRRLNERYVDELAWMDDDGKLKVALFELERERCGKWYGEDLSFCRRARAAGIPIVAPVEGLSVHDGHHLQLQSIP